MKTIYKIIAIVIILVITSKIKAQDPNFTQLVNHPILLNPALISSNNDFRLTLAHRAQWQSIEQGYQTESFSIIYPLFLKKESWRNDRGNAKLDIGFNVTNDRAGAYNTLNNILAISSALKINSTQFLSLAVYGGYIYKMLDVNNLTFDNQYVNGTFNPNIPTGEVVMNESAGAPDVGFGMAWFYVPTSDDAKLNAYAGLSGFHLNEYNSTFLDLTGKLQTKFSFQAGVKLIPEERIDIRSHIGYSTQGGINKFYVGLLTGIHLNETGILIFGSWFKEKEAVALQLGYHHQSFIFDMSYDFPYTDVSRSFNNLTIWEVSLGYKLNRMKRKSYVNTAFF